MRSTDIMLLERCAAGAVSFTHEPNPSGRGTRLVRSSISPSQQKKLRELANGGYVAEAVSGDPIQSVTTVTYTLTALGRNELGIHAKKKQRRNNTTPPTDSALERESRDP